MEKLDGKSMDIVAENIEKLKEIFPDVFTEGKVDFEALEATLGEYVEGKEERYSFNWNGKAAARRIAQTPSTGTLRPAPEESKDWESTENLYIEGDNLEVHKLLQKSYHKQVKMIYIDPPYNTGKDFVYKDNYKDNIKNYMEQTGQLDTVEAIVALKEKSRADDLMRVVFRDNGFKDAEVKTNAIQILKQSGIDDVKSL